MAKLKTHQGMKKRIKLTKKGKLKRGRAFGNHLLEKKSRSLKRSYRQEVRVSDADKKNIKRMIGQ